MTSIRRTLAFRSRRSPEKRRPSIFWPMAGIALPIMYGMTRYRFTSESRLPAEGPCIVAPNHMSEIDPIAVGVSIWRLGRLPHFMAKASLFRIPIIGSILRWSGQIPVERSGRASVDPKGTKNTTPRNSSLEAARQIISQESVVIVYPEGTLTRDPKLWPMRGKPGAVRLALEHGLPLYPLAHWGVQELMPRYGRGIKPFPRKTVHINVGPPLDLSEFEGKPLTSELLTQATDKLMAEIARLLGELRGETPPLSRWNPADHQQTETGRFTE